MTTTTWTEGTLGAWLAQRVGRKVNIALVSGLGPDEVTLVDVGRDYVEVDLHSGRRAAYSFVGIAGVSDT